MERQIVLPELNESLAYFLGFLLGDGFLGAIIKPVIYFSGDLIDELDFYTRVVIPLISRLFGRDTHTHVKKGQQAFGVAFNSRQLIEHLTSNIGYPEHGSPKLIPRIIRNASPNIRRAFLCGLFDADGTLVFSLKSYGSYCYPTIEIKSVDRAIADAAREMLIELGFKATIRKSAESWVVSLNGEALLERWMKLIGSHNIKHLSKYLLWKEYGSCPPHTRVPERLIALHLDYERFYPELSSRTGINALSFSPVRVSQAELPRHRDPRTTVLA